MEKFVARERELKELNEMYQSPNFEMAVIYGRRRVGKTALIRQFIKDKPAIYSQGIETTSNLNLVYLSQAISNFESPGQVEDYQSFTDYRAAFEKIQGIANKQNKKLVFVLDEYPYYASSDQSISSILQFMIDHVYKEYNNIMLILCGSSMSFMEHQVMGYKSPLYGRRTGQFKLKPFNIFDTKKMLPHVSNEDLLAYCGITGGIPQYLENIDETKSIEQNIESMFLHERSPLRYEPNVLLQQELRNPTMYFAILTAIANGKSKYNDIFQAVNLKSSNALSPYLSNLIDLGIIEQKKPILESNSRKSIYSFQDGLFRFWFKFIAGAQDQIALGVINGLKKYIFSELPRFLGSTFEQASADWVWHNVDRLPIEPRTVAHWWGNNPRRKREEEVDLVAPDFNNQEAIIGECKWRNSDKLKPEMVDLLEERAMLIPKVRKHDLYFFVKESNPLFDKYAQSKGVTVVKYQNFFR